MESTGKELAHLAIGLLDLTSLNAADNDAHIVELCRRALTPFGPVASVCVYPRFVALARKTLRQLDCPSVRLVTVANFPFGGSRIAPIIADIEQAIAAGVDEVDVVYPYHALIAAEAEPAKALLGACRAVCEGRVRFKVILETGVLRDPQLIRRASLDAIEAGADFIKTSTGKSPVSATEQAVRIILTAIAESEAPVGIKVCGGIRTLDDVRLYVDLVHSRFGDEWLNPERLRMGAIGLLDELSACLRA